jgi:hypothetical protein
MSESAERFMHAHRDRSPGWMARSIVRTLDPVRESPRLAERLDRYCGPRMCGGCGQRFHGDVLELVVIGGGEWRLCTGCRALARS